jgi:hypothetical protein
MPALADTDIPEIRLGQEPPPAATTDKAKVNAVVRLLAARQAGSVEKSAALKARALLHTKDRLDDVTIFGPKESVLAAFDFHDEGIAAESHGLFSVSVFLIFANAAGQVVESRDEELIFSKEGDSYVCTSLRDTNLISWSQTAVTESAASLGASRELDQAQQYLRESTARKSSRVAYSVADIEKGADGKVVVQCLRFRSDPGRRGFEVITAPIVLLRKDDSIRIESN